MKSPRRTHAAVLGAASVAAAAVVALPADADTAHTAQKARTPDVTSLFRQAVHKVRAKPTFKRAIMLEADGKTDGNRRVRGAGGIVRWRFVLDNQETRGSRFDSAFIHYGPPPRNLGKIHGVASPFLEDRRLPHAPKMTLTRAVKLLRKPGFDNGFFNVTLRKPLTQQEHTHPLYIFAVAKGGQSFVAVTTKTNTAGPLQQSSAYDPAVGDELPEPSESGRVYEETHLVGPGDVSPGGRMRLD